MWRERLCIDFSFLPFCSLFPCVLLVSYSFWESTTFRRYISFSFPPPFAGAGVLFCSVLFSCSCRLLPGSEQSSEKSETGHYMREVRAFVLYYVNINGCEGRGRIFSLNSPFYFGGESGLSTKVTRNIETLARAPVNSLDSFLCMCEVFAQAICALSLSCLLVFSFS